MKRAIIVHGWDGYPEEGWFPWLKSKLEKNGFEVSVPQFPAPETPHIKAWTRKLAETAGKPDENTYLIGHSIGCQTILRYLETLQENVGVGGAVFVAGWFRLMGLEEEIKKHAFVADIAKEWVESPLNFQKIKSHLPKSIAIFSDNDYYVSLDNTDDFRDKLGSKIIIEEKMGHFSGDRDGVKELPVVLKSVLEL
jgi:hypothetical protein